VDKPTTKTGKQLKANRQALVFLSCVVLAMFIWCVNALNKQYSTTVEQTLIYKGLPSKISAAQLPKQLIIEISGRGFDLMQYHLNSENKSFLIDLNKLSQNVFTSNYSAINTSQLLTASLSNAKSQITLLHVTPELIQLDSREHFSKKIPVKAAIKYSFQKQYAQSGVLIIQPDSIYVSGDSLTINKLSFVETEAANFELLNRSLFRSIKIKSPASKNFSYSTDKVWVYMKVEPYTEGSVTIPVHLNNSGMRHITLVPDLVTVNYHVPLSLYNTIRAEQFEASTDFKTTIDNSKLKVVVVRKPKEVSNVTVSPEQIDFFIKQK